MGYRVTGNRVKRRGPGQSESKIGLFHKLLAF